MPEFISIPLSQVVFTWADACQTCGRSVNASSFLSAFNSLMRQPLSGVQAMELFKTSTVIFEEIKAFRFAQLAVYKKLGYETETPGIWKVKPENAETLTEEVQAIFGDKMVMTKLTSKIPVTSDMRFTAQDIKLLEPLLDTDS